MMKGRDILAHLAIKYGNEWKRIYQAIQEKELIEKDELGESLSTLEGDFITIIDEDYPDAFKVIPMPPFVIFLSEADRKRIGGDSEVHFKGFEMVKNMKISQEDEDAEWEEEETDIKKLDA